MEEQILKGVSECDQLIDDKLRVLAKKKHVLQYYSQVQTESQELLHRIEEQERKLVVAQEELKNLDRTIHTAEEQGSIQRSHLVREIKGHRADGAAMMKKLEAKQKKFRMKTKNEISTLKRRVTFLSTELENNQIAGEDILSSILQVRDQHAELTSQKLTLEAKMTEMEVVIASLRDQIDTLDASNQGFDTSKMKLDLERMNGRVDAELQNLRLLRIKHDKLRDEHMKVCAATEELEKRLARDIDAATKHEIQEAVKAKAALTMEVAAATKLLVQTRNASRTLTKSNDNQQKLLKQLQKESRQALKATANSSIRLQEAQAKLVFEKSALETVEEVAKHSKRYQEELDTARSENQKRMDTVTTALHEEEKAMELEFAAEEERLKAELQKWTKMVEAVQCRR